MVASDSLFDETERALLEDSAIALIRVPDTPAILKEAQRNNLDVVMMDLSMPGSEGMDTIHRLKEIDPDLPIILFEGDLFCKYEGGAFKKNLIFDFLHEPIESSSLLRTVQHAVDQHQLFQENRLLTEELQSVKHKRKNHPSARNRSKEPSVSTAPLLVGESKPIQEIRRLIEEVAPSDITVLIDGESGTGKDVIARLIHEMSSRANIGEFIKINCPAVPEQLVESELFGHEAGAFTGAQRRKPGRLELAVGGTVFFDEISTIPPTVQAKLLQVLESRQFTRLGDNHLIQIDARFLATTNISLPAMVENNQFRLDLYYRLNQYTIHVPPLRERVDDIPLLVNHFLETYGPIYGNQGVSVSSQSMSYLVQYPWPGNVRELESAMRRYALTGREESIHSLLLGQEPAKTSEPGSGIYHENEKKVIVEALTRARWNRRRAAEILGISYNTLRRRIAQYELVAVPPSQQKEIERRKRNMATESMRLVRT